MLVSKIPYTVRSHSHFWFCINSFPIDRTDLTRMNRVEKDEGESIMVSMMFSPHFSHVFWVLVQTMHFQVKESETSRLKRLLSAEFLTDINMQINIWTDIVIVVVQIQAPFLFFFLQFYSQHATTHSKIGKYSNFLNQSALSIKYNKTHIHTHTYIHTRALTLTHTHTVTFLPERRKMTQNVPPFLKYIFSEI